MFVPCASIDDCYQLVVTYEIVKLQIIPLASGPLATTTVIAMATACRTAFQFDSHGLSLLHRVSNLAPLLQHLSSQGLDGFVDFYECPLVLRDLFLCPRDPLFQASQLSPSSSM